VLTRSWMMITSRPSFHRTSIPHQPRGGLYRDQAFPLSARRLPTRQHPPNDPRRLGHHQLQHATLATKVQGQAPIYSPTPTSNENPPPTRTLSTRPRANNGGALHTPQRALGGAGQRASDADADPRARARGARAQSGDVPPARGVGHGAHRARAVFARCGGRGERDTYRVADMAR
jgi:hypothetical protein